MSSIDSSPIEKKNALARATQEKMERRMKGDVGGKGGGEAAEGKERDARGRGWGGGVRGANEGRVE